MTRARRRPQSALLPLPAVTCGRSCAIESHARSAVLDCSSIPAKVLDRLFFEMKVVLTRKLADCMDGVDVADRHVGDVLDLEPADARVLIAEQWAIPDRRREHDGFRVNDGRRVTDVRAETAGGTSSPEQSASDDRARRLRSRRVDPSW